MKLDRLVCLSSVIVVSTALASCGGKPAAAVRPTDFTAKEALGAASPGCTGEPKLARPLIVDLDAAARVDLEAAMKKAVVVVAYDCNHLRVLSTCKLGEGKYEYVGVGRKEQVIQMKGADELQVNLPLSAGKLGAEVQAGRTIDLGLVYVGRRTTAVGQARRAELTGSCDGATHYLQNATIGAFALSTGSTGKVAAVAELFTVGGSAKSESSKSTATSDGSLDACRKADPASAAPPPECASPLRLELSPFSDKAAPPSPAEGETPKADDKKVEANPCRAGYVYAADRCTKPTANEAYLCEPGDRDGCKAQCDKGNAGSCFNYAGTVSPANAADATASFLKACDGGEADGCVRLASDVIGKVKKPADDQAAFARGYEWAKKACDMGNGTGCLMASSFELATPSGGNQAVKLRFWQRGCGLGERTSCRQLASAYFGGYGVPRDVPKGIEFLSRGCEGGDEHACSQLVTRFNGEPARALSVATKACDANDRAFVCEQAATMMVKQERYDEAFPYAKKACDGFWTWCRPLIKIHQKGTKKDPAAADVLTKKICADKAEKLRDATSADPICPKDASNPTTTPPAATTAPTTKPAATTTPTTKPTTTTTPATKKK